MDAWVLTSFAAALLAMTTSVMVRKRKWQGYALMIPAQLLYAWLAWEARLYGFLLLNIFYLINAYLGYREWRALARRTITVARDGRVPVISDE